MNAVVMLKPVEASVQKTETWTETKKFTVYKVAVATQNQCWFVFRRYNEFHKLYETLKKKIPNLNLKLPGKKLFGNNLDPQFVASRKQGLDAFIQDLVRDQDLLNLTEVQEFLKLNQDSDDQNDQSASPDPINLGPSERHYARPSDFEFLNVIGKGSFGKVILARHKTEQQYYAVKVLSKSLIMRHDKGHHIMSERNVLLKNLHHPFLVSLKYSFQTPSKLYFVLDYINGGELFFHLQKEGKFPEVRARFYTAEITCALGYLHERGVIYRDLKPENLLLDRFGHIVLTDFGLSKEGLLENDTTDTFCGTVEYLAPEVIKNEPYDRSVDWWCLGAVLYEMLYGLPPFYSSNTAKMCRSILFKPLTLRPGISNNARHILTQLLEKESSNRLGSGCGDAEDVKHHQFFTPLNFEELVLRKIPPPFVPDVAGSLDFRNIDPTFLLEPVTDSLTASPHKSITVSVTEEESDAFVGFSYPGPNPSQMEP